MKPRFRFAPPPLDSSARVPIALACVLVAALVAQLVVSDAVALPEGGAPVAAVGGADARGPAIEPARGGAALVARDPFVPGAAAVTAAGGGAAAPLPGIGVVGSIGIGRAAFAVVRAPDGRTLTLPVGGAVGGARLRGVTPTAAIFERDGARFAVPFGTAAAAPPSPNVQGQP